LTLSAVTRLDVFDLSNRNELGGMMEPH